MKLVYHAENYAVFSTVMIIFVTVDSVYRGKAGAVYQPTAVDKLHPEHTLIIRFNFRYCYTHALDVDLGIS